jgi:alpha-tubulin suppressor-like RCC1 family protein
LIAARAGRATVFAAALLAAGSAGCLGKGLFRCQKNEQCGARGYCEATTHVCSFEDHTCQPSQRRYGSHAGDALSGRCVNDSCQSNPVIEVRGGGAHACVVRQSGDIACWGAGSDGQLGDGAARARSTPAPVMTASGLQGAGPVLALGARHTCALAAGSVWCWGANESGQLGLRDTRSRSEPTRVPDLSNVAAIAAGGAFTCAVGTDGTVACWGRNVDGELGVGGLAGPGVLTPTAVPALVGVQALAARDRHACALTVAGGVSCWGSNEQGELGDGTRVSRAAPVAVTALEQRRMRALAAGTAHTCAIEATGALWCWGANQLGELGDGTNESRSQPVPVPLLAADAVTHVVAAGHHTCARQANGNAWCWGANQAGQLGEGTTGNIGVPVPVTGVEDAADLTAGDTFSCVRRNNGTVWCWGDDRSGQLGTGVAIERTSPVRVTALDRAQAITAGGAHSCALEPSTDGAATTVCWGENQAGQLGDGTRLDRSTAVALKISLNAREVVAGMMHSCLRGGDRSVWCWGRGNSGQLGNATLIDVVVPTNVNGLTDAARLAAGRAHTCVLQQTAPSPPQGRVLCWGANDDGQLGDGSTVARPAPVAVMGGADVVDLAAGGAHTCALHGDGTITCWGRGTEGQLGNSAMLSSATPVPVQNVTNAIDLSAGDRHTCAVLGDEEQTVSCWGEGADGQLGWGSTQPRTIPAKVMGLAGAVEVSAGDNHTCARTSAGLVFCWGANDQGQLGNGTHLATLTPGAVPVPMSAVDGIPLNALELAAGGAHTCALRGDHTVACWGSDAAGQLGAGTALQYSTAQPVQIACP